MKFYLLFGHLTSHLRQCGGPNPAPCALPRNRWLYFQRPIRTQWRGERGDLAPYPIRDDHRVCPRRPHSTGRLVEAAARCLREVGPQEGLRLEEGSVGRVGGHPRPGPGEGKYDHGSNGKGGPQIATSVTISNISY